MNTRTILYNGMLLLLAALFLWECGDSSIAGNSSQTGSSGITVATVDTCITGITVPNAEVSLYSERYSPETKALVYSNSIKANGDGKFVFHAVPQDYYDLFVNINSDEKMGFIGHIPLFRDSSFASKLDSLRSGGFLQGTIIDTNVSDTGTYRVYIKGSPFFTTTSRNELYKIGPVPAGSYKVIAYLNQEPVTAHPPITFISDVSIESGSVSIIKFQQK